MKDGISYCLHQSTAGSMAGVQDTSLCHCVNRFFSLVMEEKTCLPAQVAYQAKKKEILKEYACNFLSNLSFSGHNCIKDVKYLREMLLCFLFNLRLPNCVS